MSDLLSFLIAAALAIVLRVFVLSLARIKGRSMLPTLHNGDWAFVGRLPFLFGRPRRFDVVICHFPGRRMRRLPFLPQSFVKRVVGLPGETLEVIEGVIHINGQPIQDEHPDPPRGADPAPGHPRAGRLPPLAAEPPPSRAVIPQIVTQIPCTAT